MLLLIKNTIIKFEQSKLVDLLRLNNFIHFFRGTISRGLNHSLTTSEF